MNDRDKIEEAHGIWELAIVRLGAMVEVGAGKRHLDAALAEERRAFKDWKDVSSRAMLAPTAVVEHD